jgi:hypothetical protein
MTMIVALLAVDVGNLSAERSGTQEFVDAARAELRSYRALVRQKRSDFWRNIIESQRRNPQHMWQSIDKLMGR